MKVGRVGGADTIADRNQDGAHSGSDDCGSTRVEALDVQNSNSEGQLTLITCITLKRRTVVPSNLWEGIGFLRSGHKFSAAIPQLLTFYL